MIDESKFNKEFLMKQITVHGRGVQLKTNRPKDGIATYVWRLIRFDTGIDLTQPTSCFFLSCKSN